VDPRKNHNILVLDEDIEYAPLIEQILVRFFSNMSNVFWFENEDAILDFINIKTPSTISIVLLDIENSNFDGIAVLKHLKGESSPLKIIPVIIFSRLQDVSVIRQCFSLGANSWVHKPTDLTKFQEILEVICEFWLKHTILPSNLL
jgi:two-component system response regulator